MKSTKQHLKNQDYFFDMKTWYQVWLPPYGDRKDPKVFGIRVFEGIIDSTANGYTSLLGLIFEQVKDTYEKRGAIISKILQ